MRLGIIIMAGELIRLPDDETRICLLGLLLGGNDSMFVCCDGGENNMGGIGIGIDVDCLLVLLSTICSCSSSSTGFVNLK